MEMTARRWRAGSLRLQINGMGRAVTRKSVKILMTLAEKTILPPSRHLYGYLGLTSQYALIGLHIIVSLDDHGL
jgi:hypothetical protein